MLPPKMIEAVRRVLEEAGVSGPAFANIAALQGEQLEGLARAINALLPEDRRLHPVEVLTDHGVIGYVSVTALREAGFCTLGDLVNRVAWQYPKPPELAKLPTWGDATILYLYQYLVRHGLLSPR